MSSLHQDHLLAEGPGPVSGTGTTPVPARKNSRRTAGTAEKKAPSSVPTQRQGKAQRAGSTSTSTAPAKAATAKATTCPAKAGRRRRCHDEGRAGEGRHDEGRAAKAAAAKAPVRRPTPHKRTAVPATADVVVAPVTAEPAVVEPVVTAVARRRQPAAEVVVALASGAIGERTAIRPRRGAVPRCTWRPRWSAR